MKPLPIISVILLISVLAGSFLIWNGRAKQSHAIATSPSPEAFPTELPAATASQIANSPSQMKTEPVPGTGRVEGPLTYPGEAVPPDLRVCAQSLDTGREACIGQLRDSRFPGGVGYRLDVPAGRYHVFALSDSFEPGYRAYYSAFVTCGYHVGCTDHTPLAITIKSGQILTGIEPGDFYR